MGKYTWVDKGWESIRKRVADGPANTHARVGFIGPESEQLHPKINGIEEDLTIEEVGLLNEFGSKDGHTPERSFLRRALQWKNRGELKYMLAQAARSVIFSGMTRKQAMVAIGAWGVDKVREQILGGETPPPQAQFTIDKKGHDNTLYEMGIMAQAIRFAVMVGDTIVLIGDSK